MTRARDRAAGDLTGTVVGGDNTLSTVNLLYWCSN